ncbi:hypothetical protein QFZ20_002209 [Flavobacterium sp. W4I14]|nr:hypothetical protein [Flavobacterium sp. W4I14]
MEYIKLILSKQEPSIDELIASFERVKENGDVAIIKFDGERIENGYTVFISFNKIKKLEMIRIDGNNLKDSLQMILRLYIKSQS